MTGICASGLFDRDWRINDEESEGTAIQIITANKNSRTYFSRDNKKSQTFHNAQPPHDTPEFWVVLMARISNEKVEVAGSLAAGTLA